jgi:uncharacterized membrane protein YfcA
VKRLLGWFPAHRGVALGGVVWIGVGAAVATAVERHPAAWWFPVLLWVLVICMAALAWSANRDRDTARAEADALRQPCSRCGLPPGASRAGDSIGP